MEWRVKMNALGFTRSELESFTVAQLKRVCKYYDIEVFKSWDKTKLVEVLIDYFPPVPEPKVAVSTNPNKSVRVLRIEAQNRRET
jgi:hypothetical protein